MEKPKKSTKHAGGRPEVIDSIKVTKLEQAFAIDASVEEACSYAEVSRKVYYEYIKRHPEFGDRIAVLRQKPILKARQAVVQKLDESYSNAMDYLKRKKKAEFGDNVDVTSGGETIKGVEISVRK